MKKRDSYTLVWLLALLCALTMGACNNDAATPEVEGEPVISAATGQGSASRLPREVARLALVDGDTHLRDFVLDEAAGIAYATDSAYRLHIVALDPLAEVANFQVNGDLLTLDAANQRLYIAPYDSPGNADPVITIFDTANRQVVGQVVGERVAVDSARNRFYVGEEVPLGEIATGQTPPVRKGVRLYDGATQAAIAQGEKAGVPLYNPIADELIIVNYSAFTADPETLALRRDLFPEISEQSLAGCTGCQIVRTGWVFPDDGLVAFDVTTIGSGGGPGAETGPIFMTADKMEPSSVGAQVADTCSSQPALTERVGDTLLDHDRYVRYEVYNNLSVRSMDGEGRGVAVRFKDGLGGAFVNGATGAAFIPNGAAGTWVIDAQTLEPLGVVQSLCPWIRASSGTLYAADGAQQSILALAETGGTQLLPAAEPLFDGLAGNAVRQILLSPAFAEDNTIFLVATQPTGGDRLLRSSDGGANWTALGGLPMGNDLSLVAAISPDYANDRTLFIGGTRSTYGGEGVWQSNDGGDTWLPHWTGLEHLRVNQVVVSPNYREDGSLLAYADFVRIDPWQKGVSINRSGDGGITWSTMTTAETAAQLPSASNWLPIAPTEELPVRKLSFAEPIQVQRELGEWQSAPNNLGANEASRAILTTPDYPEEPVIFVITDLAVRRTLDSGRTWQLWLDPRVANLTFDHLITDATGALGADGAWRIMLGTQDGNLWQEDPSTMEWGDPEATIPSPPPISESALANAVEQAAASDSPLATPASDLTTGVEPTPAPAATIALPTPTPAGEVPAQVQPEPTATNVTTVIVPTTPTPAVSVEPLPATAPAGLFVPQGLWGSTWANDAALQQALGYALAEVPSAIPAAYQFFERGVMIWRSDDGMIYALLNDGTWSVHEDTFVEGEPERDPNIFTPGSTLQPERGFGKLWRNNPALKDAIGWGTAEEQGVTAQLQEFERGFAVRVQGMEYFVIDGGAWRTR